MTFTPSMSDSPSVTVASNSLTLGPGSYNFSATFTYPQLTQLSATAVLDSSQASLVSRQPDETDSLSFLSYSDKTLAGTWRFLTYFGRDTLIFLLLAEPILSDQAMESILSAALERVNNTSGAVCHEETIGDYATYLNLQKGISSTAPACSYIMIDSDYYLPIAFNIYANSAPDKAKALLNRAATTNFGNAGTTYSELLALTAKRIVDRKS